MKTFIRRFLIVLAFAALLTSLFAGVSIINYFDDRDRLALLKSKPASEFTEHEKEVLHHWRYIENTADDGQASDEFKKLYDEKIGD